MNELETFKKLFRAVLLRGSCLDYYASQGRMLGILSLEEFHRLLAFITRIEQDGSYDSVFRELSASL